MAYITADARHLVVPARQDIATIIPHARLIEWRGEKMLVVPNGREEARVIRNLGIEVPPPIISQYDWAGQKPWEIQKTTAALLTENQRFYVLSSMGTGKTRSAIFATDYLLKAGVARRALVVAPLSTLTPVWQRELFQVLPREQCVVLHASSRDKRLELLRQDARWFVINHHGIALLQAALIDRRFDVLIVDELAIFRNRSTRLWKSLDALIESGVKFVWGMTGSPTPRAPTDAWAQAKLLTPHRVPRTFTYFRDQTMRQLSQFTWVPRQESAQVVHRAMQPSVRYSRDDVEELPETTYVDRAVALSPEARRVYDAMMNRLRVMHAEGTITAANEGILQGKLLQIACGYVYSDTRGVVALPNQGRLNALEEVLSETDRQVLVFVPFIHALKGVADHLRRCGENIAMVYGETPRGQRDAIFTRFQEGRGARVIVAHPHTMAHGLTLTAANTIVWFSPINSLEYYEQANARITRPGQKHKTLIVHITGTGVERRTYQRLRSRGRMQGVLLDMFHDQDVEM